MDRSNRDSAWRPPRDQDCWNSWTETQSLELQLREATMFRRSEVAALAARSLVGMGRSDVYFGG